MSTPRFSLGFKEEAVRQVVEVVIPWLKRERGLAFPRIVFTNWPKR
jgi:hypothetical protein